MATKIRTSTRVKRTSALAAAAASSRVTKRASRKTKSESVLHTLSPDSSSCAFRPVQRSARIIPSPTALRAPPNLRWGPVVVTSLFSPTLTRHSSQDSLSSTVSGSSPSSHCEELERVDSQEFLDALFDEICMTPEESEELCRLLL
mmetsp:Transcript_16725/g.39383  ORF Transcript_16725/g.39383 Transcript_16725/m.39383 type:complete len:146 (+) Transcript_16725:280-717(+)